MSKYIGDMTVLWVEVPDEPGPNSRRVYIERNALALLSNGLRPVDRPSGTWLGKYSPRSEIQQSGLWNLNHVDEQYEPEFLNVLADSVEHTKLSSHSRSR